MKAIEEPEPLEKKAMEEPEPLAIRWQDRVQGKHEILERNDGGNGGESKGHGFWGSSNAMRSPDSQGQ